MRTVFETYESWGCHSGEYSYVSFSDMTPCSLVGEDQRLGAIYCLHLLILVPEITTVKEHAFQERCKLCSSVSVVIRLWVARLKNLGSITDRHGDFSLRHRYQTPSDTRPASCPVGTGGGSILRCTVIGAWHWPPTFHYGKSKNGSVPPLPYTLIITRYLICKAWVRLLCARNSRREYETRN
jgi:hypothetical protein